MQDGLHTHLENVYRLSESTLQSVSQINRYSVKMRFSFNLSLNLFLHIVNLGILLKGRPVRILLRNVGSM